MWIASFDIGKKNFAFCIEEIDDDGEWTPHTVCQRGRLVLLDNVDLTRGVNEGKRKAVDPLVYINMNTVLSEHLAMWEKCDVILIEQQMNFGKARNGMALKLAQHCYSFFLFHYGLSKTILEFPAYNKTKMLGAPEKLTKPQRKKWAVEKAINILTDRKDSIFLENIQRRRKKDDVADVILQLQSYKYLHFILKKL